MLIFRCHESCLALKICTDYELYTEAENNYSTETHNGSVSKVRQNWIQAEQVQH